MKDKELRRLSRSELLELLIRQSRRVQELSAQMEALEQECRNREIHLKTSGSIADAAMSLSEVFEAAQQAIDLYSENAQRACHEKCAQYEQEIITMRSQLDGELSGAKEQAEKMLSDARTQADAIVAEAKRKAAAIHSEALERTRKLDQENFQVWEEILGTAKRTAEQVVQEERTADSNAPRRRRSARRRRKSTFWG